MGNHPGVVPIFYSIKIQPLSLLEMQCTFIHRRRGGGGVQVPDGSLCQRAGQISPLLVTVEDMSCALTNEEFMPLNILSAEHRGAPLFLWLWGCQESEL